MSRITTSLLALAALVCVGGSGETPSEPASGPTGNVDSGAFTLTSKDFADGAEIPVEHTCDGPDRSPSVAWTGAPQGTKAFAIVCQDPDAGGFVHWVAWSVPAAARALDGSVPPKAKLGDGTMQAKNDFERMGYSGPCPPKGEKHEYVFRIYALEAPLEVEENATAKDVIAAAKKQSAADAKLTVTYERQ